MQLIRKPGGKIEIVQPVQKGHISREVAEAGGGIPMSQLSPEKAEVLRQMTYQKEPVLTNGDEPSSVPA